MFCLCFKCKVVQSHTSGYGLGYGSVSLLSCACMSRTMQGGLLIEWPASSVSLTLLLAVGSRFTIVHASSLGSQLVEGLTEHDCFTLAKHWTDSLHKGREKLCEAWEFQLGITNNFCALPSELTSQMGEHTEFCASSEILSTHLLARLYVEV